MKSVIEEIYLNKPDNEDGEKTENYRKIRKEAEEVIERIKAFLPDGQKEQLAKLYNLMCYLVNEQGLAAYKQGFKEGVLLAYETFNP
ncbi:MAG: hypothetical protein K2L67_02755 [Clostridia bacterium]|nr:hypothetical protein [Clostridia bacterium]